MWYQLLAIRHISPIFGVPLSEAERFVGFMSAVSSVEEAMENPCHKEKWRKVSLAPGIVQ